MSASTADIFLSPESKECTNTLDQVTVTKNLVEVRVDCVTLMVNMFKWTRRSRDRIWSYRALWLSSARRTKREVLPCT